MKKSVLISNSGLWILRKLLKHPRRELKGGGRLMPAAPSPQEAQLAPPCPFRQQLAASGDGGNGPVTELK